MTNLSHIANYLRKEADRLFDRAAYLENERLATSAYCDRIDELGEELEKAADHIERYLELRKNLRTRRIFDTVPAQDKIQPRKVKAVVIAAYEQGGDDEDMEDTIEDDMDSTEILYNNR